MSPASENSRRSRSQAAARRDELGDNSKILEALQAAGNRSARDPAQPAPPLQLSDANNSSLADMLSKPQRPVTLTPAAAEPAGHPATSPQSSATVRGRQKTVSVSIDVRDRFNAYRKSSGFNNNRVIFTALNNLSKQYAALIAARHVAMEPEGLFGSEYVPGRRGVSDNPSPKVQLSFQPTESERAQLEEQARKAGAESVSELIDAVLDRYLPTAAPRRPHRATSHTLPDAT